MQRISELLIKKISSALDPEEEELQSWRNENEENARLYDRLTDPASLKASLDLWSMVDTQRSCREMQYQVNRMVRHRHVSYYISVAAALAVVLLLTMFFYSTGDIELQPVAETAGGDSSVTAIEEIKPGVTYATLSDAAGHNVALNASDTAVVASVLLSGGECDSLDHELCLDVPRGGEFKVQLEDGTEVWLNSSSKLYYPKTFSGDVRKVRIQTKLAIKEGTFTLKLIPLDQPLIPHVFPATGF